MAQASDTSHSSFTLHVLQASSGVVVKPKCKSHVVVTLPTNQTLRTLPIQSKHSLDWNTHYNFTSSASGQIRLQLIAKRAFLRQTIHGEVEVTVEDLLQRCDAGQDCTLGLRKSPSGQARGHITIRLEQRPNNASCHEVVCSELLRLEQDKILKGSPEAREKNEKDPKETIGFLLNQMKPLMSLMDTASTSHPALENAWNAVSSLYKASQERKYIDTDIQELVGIMRNALDFVQNTSLLGSVLSRSETTVEKLLRIIRESSHFIYGYVHDTAMGQMWRTESNKKKLGEHKKRLDTLRTDLHDHHTGGSLANNFKSAMGKELRVVIPPPPIEIFTGRDDYLEEMERCFDLTKTSREFKKQRRFVLYGTGGIGKTQIALQFVERNSDKFTKRYMIDASSEESIKLSFVDIGNSLGIENPDISKALTRLSKLKEDWLLIYHNADIPELRLSSFFPNVAHGNIIITTRNAELSVLAQNGNFEVLVLNEEAAIRLLLQSSRLEGTEDNKRHAQVLVTKIGCLPLAIVQAGSYITSRGVDLPLYTRMYEASRRKLLRTKSGRDMEYHSPVFTTWEISYAGLDCYARTFLDICSFLYRGAITADIIHWAVISEHASKLSQKGLNETSHSSLNPMRWLRRKHRQRIGNTPRTPSRPFFDLIRWLRNEAGEWNDHRFAELIHNLHSYSLIQQSFPGIYNIHPLLHEWSRIRLTHPAQKAVQQNAWLLLYYAVPTRHDNRRHTISRTILPHLSSCGRPTNEHFLVKFARVYHNCGYWQDAAELQKCVVSSLVRKCGKEHINTLHATSDLAATYSQQGRCTDAEKLHVEVLEVRKRVLGPDHLDTLASMSCLASTYWQLGLRSEAEKLHVKVLETSKRMLGPENSSTLASMNNLALTYWSQGRQTEAEKLQVEVLEETKRVLGPDHPRTLASMVNLAYIYSEQGRWPEAEKLQVEALEATKRVSGPHHPQLTSMASLASTYRNHSRRAETERLQVEVLKARKRMLGPDHPYTLTSMVDLASTYWNQDRWSEAEELHVDVLEASKRTLGPEHSITLASMANLASTYRNQGRWIKAEKIEIEVLEASKRLLGPDHPDTLTYMNNLATTFTREGLWSEAVDLQLPCMESSIRVLGPLHHHTLTFSKNLVSLYRKLRWMDKADALEATLPPFGHSSD